MDKINIDNTTFNIYKNVKQYWVDIDNNDEWHFTYYKHNEITNNEKQYILLFENAHNTAFSHWIYDSAIFLQYFHRLNIYFDNKLKIFYNSKPNRKYKKLLFDFFNITNAHLLESDVELPDTYSTSKNNKWMNDKNFVLPNNNICICCPIINLNNINMNVDIFKSRIRSFRDIFLKSCSYKSTKNNYLFFPRNKTENLKHNDRTINYRPVFDIIKNNSYLEYDTIKTEKFIDQINLLINSKNIFLDYGSSLWVNGLFCKDSNIYVSKNLNQHDLNFKYGKCFLAALELVKENNNNIIFIS